MKFSFENELMKKALMMAQDVIDVKNPAAILSNIKLMAYEGKLIIQANNSLLRMATTFPVEIVSMQITKSVSGDKKEGATRGSDTMGMKHFVKFGLYIIKGSINVQLAEKTRFSDEDAETVKECLRTLFVNDASAARPDGSMEVVKLYWFKHNCKDGQYSSAKVHRSISVIQKPEIMIPSGISDFEIHVTPLEGLEMEEIEGV